MFHAARNTLPVGASRAAPFRNVSPSSLLDQARGPGLELVVVCSGQLERGRKPAPHRVGIQFATHLIPTLGQPATQDSLTIREKLATSATIRALGEVVLG